MKNKTNIEGESYIEDNGKERVVITLDVDKDLYDYFVWFAGGDTHATGDYMNHALRQQKTGTLATKTDKGATT